MSARGLPAPSATRRPPTLASTDPRTRTCMSPVARVDGTGPPDRRSTGPLPRPLPPLPPPLYRPARACACNGTPPTGGDPHVAPRSYRRQVRRAALALGCCALTLPSGASADKIGDTPADFAKPVTVPAKMATRPPTSRGRSPWPPRPGPRAGDTPADFPGASRAQHFAAPRTIQVVRPSARSCVTSTRPCRSRCRAPRGVEPSTGMVGYRSATCGTKLDK